MVRATKSLLKRLLGRQSPPRYVQPLPEVDSPGPGPMLEGRKALVTGAGRNVGRGIALELAAHGADVVVVDIDRVRSESVCEEVRRLGVDALALVADISRSDEIEGLMQTITREGRDIDILVNNVGIGSGMSLVGAADMSLWRRVFETNVFGPALLSKLVAENMIAQRLSGSLIFIGSVHQWRIREDAAYSSSKAATGMLVKELALELAPHGIRVNGIAPGWVEEGPDGSLRVNRRGPLHGTSIPPHYIGRAVVMLASEHYSRYTTGDVLTVDGGFSLT